MNRIPLDLQRRFEQRWAARFYRLSVVTAYVAFAFVGAIVLGVF